jgi:hypothetical protein
MTICTRRMKPSGIHWEEESSQQNWNLGVAASETRLEAGKLSRKCLAIAG